MTAPAIACVLCCSPHCWILVTLLNFAISYFRHSLKHASLITKPHACREASAHTLSLPHAPPSQAPAAAEARGRDGEAGGVRYLLLPGPRGPSARGGVEQRAGPAAQRQVGGTRDTHTSRRLPCKVDNASCVLFGGKWFSI